jgi:hypothetical protein
MKERIEMAAAAGGSMSELAGMSVTCVQGLRRFFAWAS